MRVCMLAYTFYDTDNRVRRYAETLRKRGAEVDVIALRKDGAEAFSEVINGVNVFRVQRRVVNERGKLTFVVRISMFLLKSAIFLARRQMKRRYDIIHVHNVPDFEVFAAMVPKLTGARIILDIHDILPEFYESKFNASRDSFLFRALLFLERASIAFSDHVIVSNHIWLETLVSRSVGRDKSTVVLNYPDPSIFYRRGRNGDGGRFVILYPGSLNRHQGLDIAITAFAIIKDRAPEADLHIYGDGPAKEELMRLVSRMGLEGRVFFMGSLPTDRIVGVMANADLGVVPKRADNFGNEAFSTKILEFMALGVPVVVSGTKIDRFYFDESLVRFFRPGDEKDLAENVLALIRDGSLREELVGNSLAYIAENNWEVKKKTYLDLVDSLAGKQGN